MAQVITQKQRRKIINWSGWILSFFSLGQLFFSDNRFLWLILLIVGVMLIGGLPRWSKVQGAVKAAPPVLLLSIGLVVYMLNEFGQESVTQTFVATLIGVFVIGVLVQPLINALIKNK